MKSKISAFPSSFAIFLFLFVNCQLSVVNCFAQIDIDENSQNRTMFSAIQRCDFCSGMNLSSTTIVEETKFIPAFGLYQNFWDTLFIRSEKIDIPFFDNQIKIMLIQEGNTPFAFPISGTVSTGYIKQKNRQHAGLDFSVQKKEPVVACFDGVVRIVKKYEEYENTVVIRHYNGLETLYALLDNVCVVSGQKVNAGELVGYAGIANPNKKNGFHFETRFLNEFFNPEKVISFSDRKLLSNMLTLTSVDFLFIPVEKPNPVLIPEETVSEEKSSEQKLLDTPGVFPVFHTVQTGETIFRICAKYNITEEQLRALNNIKGNNIMVGQKLRVK